MIAGMSGRECLGQIGPTDLCQDSAVVGCVLGFDLSTHICHAPERAFPSLFTVGIMEHDQASGADSNSIQGHLALYRRGVWRDPLRCRQVIDEDLGAKLRLGDLTEGALEVRRDEAWGDPRMVRRGHAHTVGVKWLPKIGTRRLTCEDRLMVNEVPSRNSALAPVLVRAARGEAVPHTPVWFMRQAGRSLPEYMAVREGVGMLDACMDADLITEITLQPVRRYDVDAAIFFSDIVLPLKAVGVDLDIVPGVGPVVAEPVRTMADVEAIEDLTPEHVTYVTRAVREVRAQIGDKALIGFAGAPFTVASYLVEGGPSKEHAKTKAMMFGAPEVWSALMAKISAISAAYLEVQVDAGAHAVQLFDSWAGALSRIDYEAMVMPWSANVLSQIGAKDVPRIHFGVGTGEILDLMGRAGADVVGVDWRVPFDEGVRRVGPRAVQGNLDPTLVFAPTEVMLQRAKLILEQGLQAPGHIFNLGHGVIPTTNPDQLKRLTDFVHEQSAR